MPRPINLVLCRYQVIHQESLGGYGDVLPWGWYMVIQRNPLRRDPLDGKSSGRRRAIGRILVTTIHPVTGLLVEGEEYEVRRYKTSPLAVSAHHRWSASKIAAIWKLRHWRRIWLRAGYKLTDNIMSMSFHMYAKTHVFSSPPAP